MAEESLSGEGVSHSLSLSFDGVQRLIETTLNKARHCIDLTSMLQQIEHDLVDTKKLWKERAELFSTFLNSLLMHA